MGKFILRKTKTGFIFNLKAVNGETIANSMIYSSEDDCLKGIEIVKSIVTDAPTENQTVLGYQVEKHPKFEMYKDKVGEFRFRLRELSGRIIAVGEGYKTKGGCCNGIDSIRRNAPEARIIKNIE